MVTRVTSACIGPPFRTLGATTLRSADVPCRIGVRWPRGKTDGGMVILGGLAVPALASPRIDRPSPVLSARSPDDRLSAGRAFRNDPEPALRSRGCTPSLLASEREVTRHP